MKPEKHPHLPFPASEFTLSTVGTDFSFLLPSDQDAVLDSVPDSAYENDRFLPYWAEHWPSAGPFFSYIMRNGLGRCKTVIELGCGLGVLSTALALQNVFSAGIDISPESCMFAACNIRSHGGLPRILCADWRALPLKSEFDLLIASDVLYEERWIPFILDCIETLVKPGGKTWIADPCRRFWEPFKEASRKRGHHMRQLHRENLSSPEVTVEIIELTQ